MISAVGTIGRMTTLMKESDKFYYKDASVLMYCVMTMTNKCRICIYHIM